MLRKWKRIIAAVLSTAMIFTCAGCTSGKNTAYALTVDGYQVKAGIYIYYSFTALTEAKNLAAKQDENLDVTDEDALKKVKLDGKDFLDYVKDKTTESCINHVAVIKHFDELGLSLTDDEQKEINSYVESSWEANEEMFEGNGISKDSLKEIMTSSYKSDSIFNAYYGEDGSENVTDDQLKEYYTENNARVRYIDMDLHDADGNDLDDAGKKEIQDMADDFLKRAKAASGEKEMLEKFDEFQEEYDEFVTAQAAEASGEEAATEAETEEETTEAVIEAETEAETEAEAAEDEESADTESDSEETADEETETEETDEEAVTTAPESEEDEETTTTTTTSPYANERVIAVVTTEEGTKEEDVTYTPSKKCYDWIFNEAETGVPAIVEDEDTMYVIVRFDITERMTDDDLWSESNVENVRYDMFSDDLQDMLDSWGNEYEVVKNEKAYKRYDPFKIETE
ncbi:MAG: hypothetical protein MR503_01310 [Oscillospiraceae bacterium]|nr:hypothetical protein [Oscillospiraceae bacterium]